MTRKTKLQKLSITLLRAAETFFLWAHDWDKLPEGGIHGRYVPPKDYPLKRKHPVYARVHAVNAQRQVYAVETKAETGE
jgi:hypothetical protein